MARSQLIADGIRGAVTINTDDIMEYLPGYTSMILLGEISGTPVSNMETAAIYHEPAKDIGKAMLKDFKENRISFVFDGTGTTENRFAKEWRDLRDAGYEINVIAVTAPSETRQERALDRSVQMGRHVPPEVVAEGRSSSEWVTLLTKYRNANKVDTFEIIENI